MILVTLYPAGGPNAFIVRRRWRHMAGGQTNLSAPLLEVVNTIGGAVLDKVQDLSTPSLHRDPPMTASLGWLPLDGSAAAAPSRKRSRRRHGPAIHERFIECALQ